MDERVCSFLYLSCLGASLSLKINRHPKCNYTIEVSLNKLCPTGLSVIKFVFKYTVIERTCQCIGFEIIRDISVSQLWVIYTYQHLGTYL